MDQVSELMKDLADLKRKGLTAAAVCVTFYQCLTQPIKERVHASFDFWGHNDPSQEQSRVVPKEEVQARLSSFLDSLVSNKGAPKPFMLKRPTALVSSAAFAFAILFSSCSYPVGTNLCLS